MNNKTQRVWSGAIFIVAMMVLVTNLDVLSGFAMSLNSGGSNESLFLNPSGDGRVVIGGDSLVVASRSADPTTNRIGQVYFNADIGAFRGYDGNQWSSINQGNSSHAISLAKASSQYLSITDANQTGLDITGDMTVEGWANFATTPSEGDGQRLVEKRVAAGNQRSYYFSLVNNSGLQLSFTISDDGITDVNKGVAWSPSTGNWYHIAAVYDASAGSVDFYVNGEHYGTQQTGLPNSIYNGTAPFVVGDSADYFNGKIDDVRVYNRARYTAEIAADFNRELLGDERGLVGYWKLDNGLKDSTSNNNDLTNNNSATFSTDRAF